MDKKRGLLWWIGQIFLWIVFFPVMLFLLLLRTRKIPKLIRIPLLVLYAGLLAFAVKEVALSDREPPVIEAKEVSANYGSVIELKDIASISDLKDDNPSMAITYCDPKVGTISKDGQSVEFSKVGDYVVKVMGQDSSENISEAEITISIKDGRLLSSVWEKRNSIFWKTYRYRISQPQRMRWTARLTSLS